jgi:hypothetical protein
MDWFLLLMRLLHVGGGAFWVGAAFTFILFVAPSTEVLPPPNRKAFFDRFVGERRFTIAILAAATLTVLSGAVLYWRVSGGLNSIWLTSATGLGFTIGGLAGLAAWFIAWLVISPTFTALSRLSGEVLAAGRPPTAEEGARLGVLGTRLGLAGRVVLALLAIAVLFMAIARYMR